MAGGVDEGACHVTVSRSPSAPRVSFASNDVLRNVNGLDEALDFELEMFVRLWKSGISI